MADLRVSELIQRTPNGQEYFEVIIPPFTPGTNRKVLLSDLSALFGGGAWGSITGTLSNQTDLQTALNAKLSITDRVQGLAFSDEVTPIIAGTDRLTFHFPYTTTIQEIWIELKTAQASGNIFTVDVHKNGTTILSTKLTIDNTEETSLTATTPPVISVASVTKGDKITIDVDQVGNGTAIGGKIWFRG